MTRRVLLPPRRRTAALVAALLVVLVALAGCTHPPASSPDAGPGPSADIAAFAADWQGGRVSDAAALTSQPAAAAQLMTTVAADLRATKLGVVPGTASRSDADTATVRADLTWTLPVAGSWSYSTTWTWKRSSTSGKWRLQFTPTMIHPELGAQQTMVVRTTPTSSGTIVDRNDAQLIGPVRVYSVIVLLNKITNVGGTAKRLANAVARFDKTITTASLTAAITAAINAGDGAYTVINLRDPEYQQVHAALAAIPAAGRPVHGARPPSGEGPGEGRPHPGGSDRPETHRGHPGLADRDHRCGR